MNCVICEVEERDRVCDACRNKYLNKGTLLIEVVNPNQNKDTPTGNIMVIKDLAFESVFHQKPPSGKIVQVEIGIMQRMKEHTDNLAGKN